jgi:hypothetical protein
MLSVTTTQIIAMYGSLVNIMTNNYERIDNYVKGGLLVLLPLPV